ncbi:MAG: serpin family protein [Candidatus Omnitrophica bacterium]|nr:serpin family protein [Candidatus Omnitrophota bacterium]
MKKIIFILATIVIISIFIFYIIYSPDSPKEDFMFDYNVNPEEIHSAKDFSLAIFFMLVDKKENLFISPYGIHSALSMAYAGADGETKEEMANVLGISEIELEDFKKSSLELKRHLEQATKETKVSIANALFLKDNYPFLENFKKDAEEYFEAKIDYLPETGKPINEWVKEKTNNKIKDIIDSGPIDEMTISILLNAIHFKAPWANEFEKGKTSKRVFYGNREMNVDMMEREGYYKHLIREDLKAVTINYKSEFDSKGSYSFHAFMPEKGLAEFYQNFDIETFNQLKEEMENDEIILRAPKFKMESNLSLVNILEEMGMEKAFDMREANFSNMVDIEKTENIFIDEIIHKTFIEIDEEGTEAAAATVMMMESESISEPGRKPKILELNKPFLFIIEEVETETILFIGHLVDPS